MATTLALIFLPSHRTLAGQVQPLPPVTTTDGRFGLCDVLPGSTPAGISWGQLAYNAGARIDRWEFRWDQVEPEPGAWDYTATDTAVQAALGAGLQVEGILIGTPSWAAAPGERAGNGVPVGWDKSYTDPNNLWADYVRETVSHYQGQVQAWEIWNEPDVHFFWMGNSDQYFHLLKVAYQVIKQINPSATVLMAGMVVPDLAFVSRVLDEAANDPAGETNHGFFDAVAWHAYGSAKLVYSNIQHFQSLLAAKGFAGTPLWVTEDGFPSSNPNGEPRQAAYVLQTIAYALAAGATKVLIYRASDDQSQKTWGLISATGEPRLGYVAFQVAARYFSGTQAVSYAPDDHLERFVFYQPNQRLVMLWSRSLSSWNEALQADQPTATQIDWQGTAASLAPSGGQFHLAAPGAQYNAGIDPQGSVVGGPPVFLLENNTPLPGLTSTSYVPPVPGVQRRLALLNRSDSPVNVQVAAASAPAKNLALQLAPDSLQLVDLDLLAGSDYQGTYVLSTSRPVTSEGFSNQAAVGSASPSARWFLATAPGTLSLVNPFARRVGISVTVFGPKGKVRTRQQIGVGPQSHIAWAVPPADLGPHSALAVRASGPVLVGSAAVPARTAVARPRSTWYAVHPSGATLAVFNPNARATRVRMRLVGARHARRRSFRLAAHRVSLLRTVGLQAAVLAATRGVAATYAGTSSTSLVTHPSRYVAFTAAARTTRVAIFNPSRTTAHVQLSLVTGTVGAAVQQETVTVPPSQVTTVQARPTGSSPRGVIIKSDTAVVSTPAS